MVTRYRMEECDTIEEARDLMLEVIKEIDSYAVNENYKVYSEYLNSIEGKELEEVIYEYIEKGIPMKMEPFFRNVNMYNLSEVAEKFNIVEGKDDRIDTPLIIAPIYYIRLKHQPSGKFSAKSIDSNNMTDLPAKTKDKKNSISPISNTPIKLGEMEVTNMGIVGSLKPVEDLLDQYANSSSSRKELIEKLLTGNPYDLDTTRTTTKDIGNNNKIFNSYFKAIGLEYSSEDHEPMDVFNELNGNQLDKFIDEYLDKDEDLSQEDIINMVKDIKDK